MSATPDHVMPRPRPRLRRRLRSCWRRCAPDRRAGRWVPAFEADWARALEDSRHSYSLSPLHDVVRTWQARLAAAPAVDAFIASEYDDSDGVALEDVLPPRATR